MKNLINLLTIALCIFSAALATGQSRDVGEFNAVDAATSVTVTLVKSNTPHVEFEMTKGVEKNLYTEVKNGTLYIKVKPNNTKSYVVTSANVTVYYDELDEITVRAGSTLRSDNTIVSEEMEVEVTSGSTANLDIESNTVNVEVNSGATLILDGSTRKGSFETSSGSTLNAINFETHDAIVEASSGSSLSIHVNNTLEAEANSGASVSYTGNVKNTNIDSGWSSSIRRKK